MASYADGGTKGIMLLLLLTLACSRALPPADDSGDSGGEVLSCASPRLHPGDLTFDGADSATLAAWCSGYNRVSGSLYLTGLSTLEGLDCLCGVDGDLWITESTLSDLSPLGALADIGGSLVVSANPSLASLSGLQGLTAVGDGVELTGLPALTDVSALAGLSRLEGGVVVGEAPELASLGWALTDVGALHLSGLGLQRVDLPALTEVRGDVVLDGLPLEGLGLDALVAVGGELRVVAPTGAGLGAGPVGPLAVDGSVRVSGAGGWSDLRALGCLTTVGGDVDVLENAGLTSLDGLGCLTGIDGVLRVQGNKALVRLDGLILLSEVDGIEIVDNDALSVVDGFTGVSRLSDDLVLTGLPELEAVSAWPFLEEVGGELRLEGLGVTAIELPALERVDGAVRLADMPALTALDGLGALVSVGPVTVEANPVLARIGPLPALWDVSSLRLAELPELAELSLPAVNALDAGLVIQGAGRLTDLRGLGSLLGVGGELVLADNPALVSVAELEGLIRVEGDLTVTGNDALPTLDGLFGLDALGGALLVGDNAALTDLTALYTLDRVEGDLGVVDNPLLPTSQAWTLVEAIGEDDVAGTITISGNAP